jgi:hypothetical protein
MSEFSAFLAAHYRIQNQLGRVRHLVERIERHYRTRLLYRSILVNTVISILLIALYHIAL